MIDITKPATEIAEELIKLYQSFEITLMDDEPNPTLMTDFMVYKSATKCAIITAEIALLTTPNYIGETFYTYINLDYTKWEEVLKILKEK